MDYYRIYVDIIYKNKETKYKNKMYKDLVENYKPHGSIKFKQFWIWKKTFIEYSKETIDDNYVYSFEENIKENKKIIKVNNFILNYCRELYEDGNRNWDDENHYKCERKRIIIKNIKEGKNTPYLLSILEYDKMMKIIKKI